MFIEKGLKSKSERLLFLGLAFITSFLYDFLVWDQNLGLGFVAFILVSILLFVLCVGLVKKQGLRWSLVLLLPITVMGFDILVYNNQLVTIGVPIFVVILLLIFFSLYTLKNPNRLKFSFLGVPVLKSADLPIAKWGKIYKDIFGKSEDSEKNIFGKIFLGFIIALPILFIFGILFAKADALFADWLNNFLSIEPVDFWRIIRTVAITLLLGGLFYVVIDNNYHLKERLSSVKKFDGLIISIVLGSINLLFAVFLFFQFKYLFGGVAFVLDNGLSFAEYARAGFFQLCWVVALSALMLIIIYRSFVAHKGAWSVSILQTLLIVQVMAVAASALKRMNLYQAEFGYTVLRLYVEWFIYFTLIILALAGFSLLARFSFRRFYHTSVLMGVLAFCLVASVNVDLVIAKENVARSINQDKALDLDYLKSLSSDTMPALMPLFKVDNLQKLDYYQKLQLKGILDEINNNFGKRDSWREINFGAVKSQLLLLQIPETSTKSLNNLQNKNISFNEEFSQLSKQTVLANCPYDLMNKFNLDNSVGNFSFSCVEKKDADQVYTIILKKPVWLFPNILDSKNTLEDPEFLKTSYLVYRNDNVSKPIFQKDFEFDIKIVSNKDYYKLADYFAPQFVGIRNSDNYMSKNNFFLQKDGSILESDFYSLDNYLYSFTFSNNILIKKNITK